MEFLTSSGISAEKIRSKNDRLSQPKRLAGELIYDFCDREPIFDSFMQYWFNRQQRFMSRPSLDKDTAPIMAIAGSPGMGKSTMFDVLAAGCGSSSNATEAKGRLLELLKSDRHDEEFSDFCDKISNAMAVCVTFNSDSPRHEDEATILDPVMALSVRLLWSHFCSHSIGFRQFSRLFTGFNYPGFSSDVITLLLADAESKDIILCVDEVMYADSESRSKGTVTKTISSILTELGRYNDYHPTIHVAVSSLCAQPFTDFITASGRNVICPRLSRLSLKSCFRIAGKHIPCWNSTISIGGRGFGTQGDLARQLVRDTAGGPRLLQFVIESFMAEKVLKPSIIVAKVWTYMSKLQYSFSSNLLDALKMALSGNKYYGKEMDVHSGCGLFVQSCKSEELDYPCIPPLLVKMLFEWVVRDSGLGEESMERQLLLSCHSFLGLDSFFSPTAPYFFERQIVHLFRIRLLLLAEARGNFTLQDLLGTPEFLWQRNGSQTYPLLQTSSLPVHEVTDEQLEEYLSQASTGAFYCPKNGSFPAVDFFVHLADGTLLLVQIKFSDEDATTRVSTTDVVECIAGLTDKLKFLADRKIVFVYCALRKGRLNFFLEKDEVAGLVPEGCSEMAVLLNQQTRSLLPYSLRLRPQFS